MRLSLNSALIILLGIVFLLAALYAFAFSGMYILPVGLSFTAVGCICCGLTDGFNISRGHGHQYTRIGLLAFAIGLPILALSVYRMV